MAPETERWDTLNGVSNSSYEFRLMEIFVSKLIRSEGDALIHGNTTVVARLILSNLTNRFGFTTGMKEAEMIKELDGGT